MKCQSKYTNASICIQEWQLEELKVTVQVLISFSLFQWMLFSLINRLKSFLLSYTKCLNAYRWMAMGGIHSECLSLSFWVCFNLCCFNLVNKAKDYAGIFWKLRSIKLNLSSKIPCPEHLKDTNIRQYHLEKFQFFNEDLSGHCGVILGDWRVLVWEGLQSNMQFLHPHFEHLCWNKKWNISYFYMIFLTKKYNDTEFMTQSQINSLKVVLNKLFGPINPRVIFSKHV